MDRSRLNASQIVVILGPTTTGKTALATSLARAMGGELVNADKFYLFDGLPIGTGRADIDGCGVPCHLYGGLDPRVDVPRVAPWFDALHGVLDGIHARGRAAIIEGSSYGLASAAASVAAWRGGLVIGVNLALDHLHRARVHARVGQALAAGLLDETRMALAAGLRDSWPLQRSVVYREVIHFLDGDRSFDAAQERITDGVLGAASVQRRKFAGLSGVRWFPCVRSASDWVHSSFSVAA